MAEKPFAWNEEYAVLGPEHEIRARKRGETFVPRKRVQMGDNNDSSSVWFWTILSMILNIGMILADFL